MMKRYLVLLLSVILWMGCTKDEGTSCKTGTLQIVNSSNYPFDMEIDENASDKISGAQTVDKELFPGNYKVTFTQAEGFDVSPTVYEYFVDIKKCEQSTVIIHKTNNKEDKK